MMPHLRPRHIQALLEKTLRFSPLAGVLGHRQVGKTTLSSMLSGGYVSLDQADALALANSDPEAFLAKQQRSAAGTGTIDECQLSPALFPALKEWVRIHRKPGQFILTGSVRFTSRKAIRESLTGRIISWELLPMDWAEQHEQPLPEAIPRLLRSRNLALDLPKNATFTGSAYRRSLEVGGLPGVFGVRDSVIRSQRFETQIATMLDRDLRLILQTSLEFRTLRMLLSALAKRNAKPLALVELSREARISLPTLRKLISAFEAMFLIRLVPSEGDFSKPVLFFEDHAECHHLLAKVPPPLSQLTAFLYQNLRTQVLYRPELKIGLSSFRSRAGHEVPLVFRQENAALGVIPADEDSLARAHSDARFFVARNPRARVLIVSAEDQDQMLSESVRWVGAGRLV